MEFQMMKRRDLQALCKMNNIPANLSNAAMSHSLSLLPFVEGLDEFLKDPTASEPGSPESSVITTPAPPRTSTRLKLTKEETQGSKLATRTRYGTKSRAVDGTDTRKTPATRTTRNKASQKQTETDLQTAFEADMEQSQVYDNNTLLGELQEISEAFSGISMNREESSLESQNQSENHAVVNHAQEVFNVDNKENNDFVNEDQQKLTEVFNNNPKVDFQSLCRRDLQSLCKKNKIPANTSNATMADALESLGNVDGLEEFLKEYNSQDPHSPTMSEMTSSCARRTWTSRRITKEPTSSKSITKSCRGSRKTVIEDIAGETNSGDVVEAVEMEKPDVVPFVSKTTISETNISGDIEYPGETNSNESQLSVIDVAVMEKPDVVGFVSDTSNGNDLTHETVAGEECGESDDYIVVDLLQNIPLSEKDYEKGNFGCLNTENFKQLEESEIEKDAYTGGLDVLEQLQKVSSAGESEDTGSQNGSENTEFQNLDEGTTIEGSDSEVFSDAGSDLCLVKNLEGAQENNQVSENFDSETTQPPVFGNNAETVLEICPPVELDSLSSDLASPLGQEENMSRNSDALISHHIEKLEASYIGHETSMEGDLESSIQTDLGADQEKGTPLNKKSLRKLKMLLKEKLQATTSLAKKMSSLTLEENDVSLAKVEEVMNEECEEPEGVYDASVSAVISGDAPDVEDLIAPSDAPGSELLDNMIKMMLKTPISVGRMNNGSDVNKENIDSESAKIPGARSGNFLLDMSMGSLKKALQHQSEKKRTALHPLASP